LLGVWPPGLKDAEKAREVNRTLAAAHRVAVAAVRAGRGSPQVGTCLQISPVHPLRPDDEDDLALVSRIRAFTADTHLDDLRAAEDPGDFIGVQYYSRGIVDSRSASMGAPPPEGAEVSQIGQEVYPAGLGELLHDVASLGLPVLITENGIATLDDTQRQRYLASHLREVKAAIDAGVDVRGYFHWSAFDNYEWGSYEPRFGLIGIDRDDDLRRIVRPSAVLYGEVARTSSLKPLAGY
jgi:beta-glucosidase